MEVFGHGTEGDQAESRAADAASAGGLTFPATGDFGNRGARLGDQQQKAANLDLYLQERFYLTPSVALVAGGQISYAKRESEDDFARIDGVDTSDTQDYWGYSPKLGVLWEITPAAQAFVNVSRSFEPPSFGELGNAANNGTGLVQLDAQTATTVEIGTRGRHGRFAWDLAYYHAWLDDELLEFQGPARTLANRERQSHDPPGRGSGVRRGRAHRHFHARWRGDFDRATRWQKVRRPERARAETRPRYPAPGLSLERLPLRWRPDLWRQSAPRNPRALLPRRAAL